MLAKMKIDGENRGGKNMLQEETTQSFPVTNLAKAGNCEYHILAGLIFPGKCAQNCSLNLFPIKPPICTKRGQFVFKSCPLFGADLPL